MLPQSGYEKGYYFEYDNIHFCKWIMATFSIVTIVIPFTIYGIMSSNICCSCLVVYPSVYVSILSSIYPFIHLIVHLLQVFSRSQYITM